MVKIEIRLRTTLRRVTTTAKRKTFHATRRGESAEEAQALLVAGAGHRCHSGDLLSVEIAQFQKPW